MENGNLDILSISSSVLRAVRGLHQKSWTPSLVYDARKVGHLSQYNVKRILKSTEVLFPEGKFL